MKPIIGILSHITPSEKSMLGITSLGNTYVKSVELAGGIPILFPVYFSESSMDAYLSMCDGFIFSGGIDVSPSFYGEEPHVKIGTTCMALDNTQIPFMQKVLAAGKPVLGICRGHQVLTVAAGGTLYQDLSQFEGLSIKHFQQTDYQDPSHQVDILPDSLLASIFGSASLFTNSYHHQAVKDPGPRLKVVAYSKDGVVEAVEVKDHPFALGLQWHPEVMYAYGNETMGRVFTALVQACAKG